MAENTASEINFLFTVLLAVTSAVDVDDDVVDRL